MEYVGGSSNVFHLRERYTWTTKLLRRNLSIGIAFCENCMRHVSHDGYFTFDV